MRDEKATFIKLIKPIRVTAEQQIQIRIIMPDTNNRI